MTTIFSTGDRVIHHHGKTNTNGQGVIIAYNLKETPGYSPHEYPYLVRFKPTKQYPRGYCFFYSPEELRKDTSNKYSLFTSMNSAYIYRIWDRRCKVWSEWMPTTPAFYLKNKDNTECYEFCVRFVEDQIDYPFKQYELESLNTQLKNIGLYSEVVNYSSSLLLG